MTKYIPEKLKIGVNGPVHNTSGQVWGVIVTCLENSKIVLALYCDTEQEANQAAQFLTLSLQKSLILEVV